MIHEIAHKATLGLQITVVTAVVTIGASIVAGQVPQMSVWYSFDDSRELGRSIGATVWPAIASGNTPSVNGTLALPGKRGNGLYLPNPVSFFGTEAARGTIALRVKPGFDPAKDTVPRVLIDLMKWNRNTMISGPEVVIYTDGAALKAWPALGKVMVVQGRGVPKKGQWTHLTLVWDCTSGTSLFVNGKKVAERVGEFTPIPLETGWPGRVGCYTSSGEYPFLGEMDDVRLFNYPLSDEQVRIVATQRPTAPNLRITGNWSKQIAVADQSKKPVRLWIEAWKPGKYATPPLWERPRFAPEQWSFTAGALPSVGVEAPLLLKAGETGTFTLNGRTESSETWALRLMTGEGLDVQEVAERGHVTAKEEGGRFISSYNPFRETTGPRKASLRVSVSHGEPAVYAADKPLIIRLNVGAYRDSGFTGILRGVLQDPDGRTLGQVTLPVSMKPGENQDLTFDFGAKLPRGTYHLTWYTGDRTDAPTIEEIMFQTVTTKDYRTLCAAGVSYVDIAQSNPCLFSGMARDGVGFVRACFSPGRNSLGSRKFWSPLVEYDFGAWLTGTVPYDSICADPAKIQAMRTWAERLGRMLRLNPMVFSQTMMGEGMNYPPCYCDVCTADFREYLRRKYRTLASLNRKWSSAYTSWADIEQLGSSRDVDEAAERLKMMRLSLELPKESVARWKKLFEIDRPRAMEWKRWHDGILIEWYRQFAEAFHAGNGHQTAAGEQPCWGNFRSHILFALGKIADLGGQDLYLPGELPATLGYTAELFLNFDLNASIFNGYGKPVMVNEMYVQHNSPELLPEAQGWWLVGRGYPLITFFTYDYYHESMRDGIPLDFGLLDRQGNPFPTHKSFVRFCKGIKQFDEQHGFYRTRRPKAYVALFMGDDVSLANDLEQGGQIWTADGVLGHNGAYWLTERNGFPVDFINDDTFDRLQGKRILVVPWCHVIRPSSLERIVAFVDSGGTVVIDGPLGLYDDCYVPYKPLPGGDAFARIGIAFKSYLPNQANTIIGPGGVHIPAWGVPVEPKVNCGEVLFRDAEGRPAVATVPLGKGKVVWFLTSLGRMNRSRTPNPHALALWRSILKSAGISPMWSFLPSRSKADTAWDHKSTRIETGGKAGLFDVSMRIKGDRELFLFLTSFFGPSKGDLLVHLPVGSYESFDALTGEMIPPVWEEGDVRLPVDLPAFGSQVIRVVAQNGRPFLSQ